MESQSMTRSFEFRHSNLSVISFSFGNFNGQPATIIIQLKYSTWIRNERQITYGNAMNKGRRIFSINSFNKHWNCWTHNGVKDVTTVSSH